MASLYLRGDKYWITFKNDAGKWRSKTTGFRHSNYGERRQAKLLCQKMTKDEEVARDVRTAGGDFADWVPRWLKEKYGNRKGTTYDRYSRSWRVLEKYFATLRITSPVQVSFDVVDGYLSWRLKSNGKRNTAIGELKLLAMILDHAIRKELITTNPARRLGLKKDRPQEKLPWHDDAIVAVSKDLSKHKFGSWMHTSFLFGLYQACRLRQTSKLPLTCIDMKRGIINYPADLTKNEKAFSQPIDPRFKPTLAKIVAASKDAGATTLPEVPEEFASLEWRHYLDNLGYPTLVHHGLRVRWATEAAKAEIPLAKAKKFVNHASDFIHAIYIKLSAGDVSDVPLRVPMPKL